MRRIHVMMRIKFLLLLVFLCFSQLTFGQISSPGLGVANTASWFAFGVRQELDTLKEWQSMSYIGIGRKSNPDNYDPLFKSAILVLNQEFYHQFHQQFQYSFALSYRRQDEYLEAVPYEHETPSIQQEFRVYGRFSYILKTSRLKLASTFRQEIRKFYTPTFKNGEEDFQLRSRLRVQLTINLDAKKNHRLVVCSEQLFSISKETVPDSWTDFNYRESRFSLYYSFSPQRSPLIFSLGYMNDLVGNQKTFDANYLAVDIVWENPFKLRKRKKATINENFE